MPEQGPVYARARPSHIAPEGLPARISPAPALAPGPLRSPRPCFAADLLHGENWGLCGDWGLGAVLAYARLPEEKSPCQCVDKDGEGRSARTEHVGVKTCCIRASRALGRHTGWGMQRSRRMRHGAGEDARCRMLERTHGFLELVHAHD